MRLSYDLYVKVDDGQRVTQWNHELHPSAYYCIDTHIETDWRIQLAKDGRFDNVSVVHSDGLKLDWGRYDVYWNPVGCDPLLHYVGPREKVAAWHRPRASLYDRGFARPPETKPRVRSGYSPTS